MRPTGPLDIQADGVLTLDLSGKHIMFTGLKRGFKKGETIDGTLAFVRRRSRRERAQAIKLRVALERAREYSRVWNSHSPPVLTMAGFAGAADGPALETMIC